MLRLENISKRYGSGENEVVALDRVSINVNEGEKIVILGKSGSGKSTLLNIMGGMSRSTEGEVYFRDQKLNYNEKAMADYRKEHIGFVFQDFKLITELNVVENISIHAKITKTKVDKEKLEELLDRLGLKDKAQRYPEELSGGQKQRVAIGRALYAEPDLLLCDEPTGALDSLTSEEIMNTVDEVNKSGTTVIMVTHNENIAQRFPRKIMLQDGRIVNENKE